MQTTSFSNDFLEYLEFYLSKKIATSKRHEYKWLWCDGIQSPGGEQLSIENITSKKQVTTTGWMGLRGSTEQDIYEFIFILGDNSLNCYLQGLNIKDCLPDDEISNWVNIDIEHKKLTIKLT